MRTRTLEHWDEILLMWLKQCHKPSPKSPFFVGWYVYHSQSWVVYCFDHRFDPDLQVFAGLEMAVAFETDQHQEMFMIVSTTLNRYCYYWLKHYLLLCIIVINVVKWLFHSSIYYLLLFLIAVIVLTLW